MQGNGNESTGSAGDEQRPTGLDGQANQCLDGRFLSDEQAAINLQAGRAAYLRASPGISEALAGRAGGDCWCSESGGIGYTYGGYGSDPISGGSNTYCIAEGDQDQGEEPGVVPIFR